MGRPTPGHAGQRSAPPAAVSQEPKNSAFPADISALFPCAVAPLLRLPARLCLLLGRPACGLCTGILTASSVAGADPVQQAVLPGWTKSAPAPRYLCPQSVPANMDIPSFCPWLPLLPCFLPPHHALPLTPSLPHTSGPRFQCVCDVRAASAPRGVGCGLGCPCSEDAALARSYPWRHFKTGVCLLPCRQQLPILVTLRRCLACCSGPGRAVPGPPWERDPSAHRWEAGSREPGKHGLLSPSQS